MTTPARPAVQDGSEAQVMAPARPDLVPIRPVPNEADERDGQRVELVRGRWTAQDESYLPLARTIEEHIRCLSGRQWDVWSEVLGRFVDPTRYMNDEERRWRQRPVMDFLGYWFMVTLSKVTENQPVVGFLPTNGDENSAKLAEVFDTIFKTLADECELPDRRMMAAAWAIAGGESYLLTRPDFSKGEEREVVGPAVLSLDREGMEPIERVIEAAPYDAEGNPLAELVAPEDGGEDYGYDVTGEAHRERKGSLEVEVASALEIRAEWGSNIPWNRKRWIIHRWFLSPDEVEARYGKRVDADTFADGDESSPGYLERLLFGSGYFGAARGDANGALGTNSSAHQTARAGYVCGYTMWEKPCADYPQGRLTVVAGEECLHDSARPYDFECAGPIRRVGFMPIPGRPVHSTPLEKMVPLQKRLNRVAAQIAEHTNLCTNPVLLLHSGAGIDSEDFTARPGLIIEHDGTPTGGGRAAEWLVPPPLSSDVWKHYNDVRDHLFTIGSITGNEGDSNAGDSGELIQQLRYNADRPLAPLTRSMELAEAGVAEDMLAILPSLWTDEEVIHVAGEDSMVRTITVLPEMWEGTIAARPVMESAAPETREKKQERIMALYQMGAFGDPASADPTERERATKKFLELSNFPSLNRAARPGGQHRVMAERNLGALMQGQRAEAIPLLPMYDLRIHRAVLEEFMSGPDYLALDPEPQNEILRFLEFVQEAERVQLVTKVEEAGDMAAIETVVGSQVAASAPQDPNAPAGNAPPASPAGPTSARPGAGPAGVAA